MGNYADLEYDFIARTIRLIEQYTAMIQELPFEEQLNYTLIINCFLGLVVMPKERVITYIPSVTFSENERKEMGLINSHIDDSILNLRDLIQNIRHSVAHFDIEVISSDENGLIDFIEFKGSGNQPETIARFYAKELYPFLHFYTSVLLENMSNHRN